MPTTCQICGRGIKAKSGLIAHHGYQRPGQGWQTSSCFGARWRPYEVACDALPPAIKSCQQFLTAQEMALAKLIAEPPATLSYNKNRYGKPEYVDVPKPADFDPRPDYRRHSYVSLYLMQKFDYERNIRMSTSDLSELEKRLANWKPTEAAA